MTDRIQYIQRHPNLYEGNKNLVCFPEIELTRDQVIKLNQGLLGDSLDSPWEYYRGKCHNSILLSGGPWTNREEQPDFQALIVYAINKLAQLALENDPGNPILPQFYSNQVLPFAE